MTVPNTPSVTPKHSDPFRRIVLIAMVVSLIACALLSTVLLLFDIDDGIIYTISSCIFSLALHCAAALYFMRRQNLAPLPLHSRIALAIIPINLLVVFVDTWWDSDPSASWFQTCMLICGAILLTPARILARRKQFFIPIILTNVITAFAVALSCYARWLDQFRTQSRSSTIEFIWDCAGCSWVISLAAALSLTLYLGRPAPVLKYLRYLIIFFISLTAATIIANICDLASSDLLSRFALVSTILSVSGVLIHFIFSLLIVKAQPDGARSSIAMQATCPKCLESITIHTGTSDCPHCNTTFDLRIRPKSCIKCNYDFSGLNASTCPECGTIY